MTAALPDADLARVRRAVLAGLGSVAVLAPLALAAVRWPRYWTWIAPEQTPMTWLQSVVLVLASAAALLLAVLLRLRHDTALARRETLGPYQPIGTRHERSATSTTSPSTRPGTATTSRTRR